MITISQARWPVLLTIIVAAALIAAVPGTAPGNPWTGAWWSIDPYDGSLQWVVFGGGGPERFNVFDWGATVCGTDENGNLYAVHIAGWATQVDATSFAGSAPIVCMAHPPFVWAESWDFSWTFDPQTNTLWDGGSMWTRTRP